jgi:hypothetical protein
VLLQLRWRDGRGTVSIIRRPFRTSGQSGLKTCQSTHTGEQILRHPLLAMFLPISFVPYPYVSLTHLATRAEQGHPPGKERKCFRQGHLVTLGGRTAGYPDRAKTQESRFDQKETGKASFKAEKGLEATPVLMHACSAQTTASSEGNSRMVDRSMPGHANCSRKRVVELTRRRLTASPSTSAAAGGPRKWG